MTERERFLEWWNSKFRQIGLGHKELAREAWEAARRWIPVEERLPESEQIVWIRQPGDIICFGCYTDTGEGYLWAMAYDPFFDDGEWRAEIELDDIEPTHWKPLPEPPEDKNE